MALSGIEPAAVARCLGQLATGAADHAEAYFERVEEVELPSDEESPGVRARHEEGLAIRLLRGSEGRPEGSYLSERELSQRAPSERPHEAIVTTMERLDADQRQRLHEQLASIFRVCRPNAPAC